MLRIFPTATLRHLVLRKRLQSHVLPLLPQGEESEAIVRSLSFSRKGLAEHLFPIDCVDALITHHLARRSTKILPRPHFSFAFVQGLNFELTYGCNLSCSHCLQSGLRIPREIKWIKKDPIKRVIHDVAWLGFLKNAINLTGGEIYLPGSPVLELIDAAHAAGLQVRSNTNGWWGGRSDFKVGNEIFETDHALLKSLKDRGLTVLALSLDARYHEYPDLLERVMNIAVICEKMELQYEFVMTDVPKDIKQKWSAFLSSHLDREPIYMIVSPMEVIDVGTITTGAGANSSSLNTDNLAQLVRNSPCEGGDFYKPSFLHVMPDGGMRNCLYAPGSGYLGNIYHEGLLEIFNRMDQNKVSLMFRNKNYAQFIEESIQPWKHLYRDVHHPCAASALIARVSDAIDQAESKHHRPLNHFEMETLHQRLAKDYKMNLSSLEPSCS